MVVYTDTLISCPLIIRWQICRNNWPSLARQWKNCDGNSRHSYSWPKRNRKRNRTTHMTRNPVWSAFFNDTMGNWKRSNSKSKRLKKKCFRTYYNTSFTYLSLRLAKYRIFEWPKPLSGATIFRLRPSTRLVDWINRWRNTLSHTFQLPYSISF